MSQGDQYFDCGFRFLGHEANSALQAIRAQYEVRLIETRHTIGHDGWVMTESGRMISHAAQIRLVDVLIEMAEALYVSAAKAYFGAVGSSEYKERVDLVEQQLLGYCLGRWAQLTRGLPLEPVGSEAVEGTALGPNEKLLSDAIAAHLRSTALELELQMWQKAVATQSREFAPVDLQSKPAAREPAAGNLHGVAKVAMGQDRHFDCLNPDWVHQMVAQFPDMASLAPGLLNSVNCIREMEVAKAKAEIAFRQQETAGKWISWDLDSEDPETALESFERSGTIYPWHPAGCDYVWELTSTYLRATADDGKPQAFEALAGIVLDVNSDKVFEEKLKAYERPIWITSESAKAGFKEYVRKRLEPLVRATCLDRWQQRLATITGYTKREEPTNLNTPTQPGDSDCSPPADSRECPATIPDAVEPVRLTSDGSIDSRSELLPVTALDGSVRWVNPESADLGATTWTTEDEKLISACVTSGRAAVRSDLEVLFGSREWPAAAALVVSFRRYAVEVFDVYASAHQHAALSVESYQEALKQRLLPMVLGDLFGCEWDRSPGEKVIRINWQIGEDRKSCGQEIEVFAANDPDPNCVYHELIKDAILHRYRFLEPPPSPRPGEPPGINLPDMNWSRYIGLNERHDLAMAIKPYLEDRVAHWQFIYSPTASARSDSTSGKTESDLSGQPKQTEGIRQRTGKERKGDASLLAGKRAVNFRTAELYLGLTERQRQNLVKDQVLAVEGKGQNRKITTDSLRAYLPPENPN